MFTLVVTVNYPDNKESELKRGRFASLWALNDDIERIILREQLATSFVFVVARA